MHQNGDRGLSLIIYADQLEMECNQGNQSDYVEIEKAEKMGWGK